MPDREDSKMAKDLERAKEIVHLGLPDSTSGRHQTVALIDRFVRRLEEAAAILAKERQDAAVKALERADNDLYQAMTAKYDETRDTEWEQGIQYARGMVRSLAARIANGEGKP